MDNPIAIEGKSFTLVYSATPAAVAGDHMIEDEARSLATGSSAAVSYCPVVTFTITPSKEKLEFKTRCAKSALTGVEDVVASITFIPNAMTDEFYDVLRSAYINDSAVFLADVYGDLATGIGQAGNFKLYSFPQAADVNGVFTVTIEMTAVGGHHCFLV